MELNLEKLIGVGELEDARLVPAWPICFHMLRTALAPWDIPVPPLPTTNDLITNARGNKSTEESAQGLLVIIGWEEEGEDDCKIEMTTLLVED